MREKKRQMRAKRENLKRMIGGILQDCKRRGKEGVKEVRQRVTRCYRGGRRSERETEKR